MPFQQYEPELGQMCFGTQAWGRLTCPEYVVAILWYIALEIERVEWNNTQEEYSSPFRNAGGKWECDAFTVRAYYWGDDEAKALLPNFQYKDIEIRWYKHVHRGTTINRVVSPEEIAVMFDECMASVRRTEKDD